MFINNLSKLKTVRLFEETNYLVVVFVANMIESLLAMFLEESHKALFANLRFTTWERLNGSLNLVSWFESHAHEGTFQYQLQPSCCNIV